MSSITSHIPSAIDRYIEPFAGSAVVFLHLNPKKSIISDFNDELIRAYRTVRSHPKQTYDLLRCIPSTAEMYYFLRSTPPSALDPITRTARFLYLNRHAFNGVYRTNAAGEFNVPRGTKVGHLPSLKALSEFSLRLKRARLLCSDFEDVLIDARDGDFVYLDPPYTDAGRRIRGEYGSGAFSFHDEERLVRSVKRAAKRGANILLSYTTRISEQFPGWRKRRISVNRSIAGFGAARGAVTEVLISNY